MFSARFLYKNATSLSFRTCRHVNNNCKVRQYSGLRTRIPVSCALMNTTIEESSKDSPFWNIDVLGLCRKGALGVMVMGVSLCGTALYADTATAYAQPQVAEVWSTKTNSKIQEVHRDSLPSAKELSAEELATIQLFQQTTPAVVNITNIVNARKPYSANVFEIPLGQGSGFLWDTKGHIVTNFHVIKGSSSLRVTLIDQQVFPAKVIGADPSRDVAVLQLDAPKEVLERLAPAEINDSSSLFVGQRVYAIGNPFGLDHSLSSGIISGLNRELGGIKNAIQSDCSINPGNSGGPLLNSRGEVIAMNTAIVDPGGKGGFNGIGFAVPMSDVKGLVDQILKFGRVIRPALGVTVAPPQALRQLGLDGVLILDVPKNSPAYKAGMVGLSRDSYGRLILGDIITGINGKPVRDQGDLFDVLDTLSVGSTVTIDSLRGGQEKRAFTVTLEERSTTLTFE